MKPPTSGRQAKDGRVAMRLSWSDAVSKTVLNAAIVITGLGLGTLHYKLKPNPDEKQIQRNASYMVASTDWQRQIAPNFELRMTNGERFHLADNVGKKTIVLNFFATWCGPCRAEMPELNRYFNEHTADNFVLVGIDAEEKQDKVDAFLQDMKLDFAAGIDQGDIQKQYGVSSFPTTVVIGVDGRVQFYETGALANADVVFNPLLEKNRSLLQNRAPADRVGSWRGLLSILSVRRPTRDVFRSWKWSFCWKRPGVGTTC